MFLLSSKGPGLKPHANKASADALIAVAVEGAGDFRRNWPSVALEATGNPDGPVNPFVCRVSVVWCNGYPAARDFAGGL